MKVVFGKIIFLVEILPGLPQVIIRTAHRNIDYDPTHDHSCCSQKLAQIAQDIPPNFFTEDSHRLYPFPHDELKSRQYCLFQVK